MNASHAAARRHAPNATIGKLHLLLRLGIAACFIGHGAFGILQKEEWLPFFGMFGIGPDAAYLLMPVIGAVDIGVGLLALFRPFRALLVWGVAWCLWTALLRPMAGLGVWELLERAGNYGVPLAFLVLVGWGRNGRDLFGRIATGEVGHGGLERAFAVLTWTTATLLVGHGALALSGKPLLVSHLAAIGLPAAALPAVGIVDLALAAWIVAGTAPIAFVSAAVWKLGTEALFLFAGSPVWEVIERGGSYVAPAAAALILVAPAIGRAGRGTRPSPAAARTAVLAVAMWTSLAGVGAAAGALERHDNPLVTRLLEGGYVLACRHAITDRSRGDADRVDLGDDATQRVLSASGVRQAEDIGREIRRLGIPLDEVLASPYQRTRRSAELSFGRATGESLLAIGGWDADRTPALFTRPPAPGTNRVLMTHQGILYRSLPVRRGSIAEGACVVVVPGEELEVLGVLELEDWRGA